MMIDLALLSLRPKANWVLNGNTYSGIEWLDTEQTCPTEEELNVEIARLRAENDATEYQRKRAPEYPSVIEQLDTLYHGGYDAWKAQIKAVKDKYPKAP